MHCSLRHRRSRGCFVGLPVLHTRTFPADWEQVAASLYVLYKEWAASEMSASGLLCGLKNVPLNWLFFYQCGIPAHFSQETLAAEIKYYNTDKTVTVYSNKLLYNQHSNCCRINVSAEKNGAMRVFTKYIMFIVRPWNNFFHVTITYGRMTAQS